jgi:hypothetical protein
MNFLTKFDHQGKEERLIALAEMNWARLKIIEREFEESILMAKISEL